MVQSTGQDPANWTACMFNDGKYTGSKPCTAIVITALRSSDIAMTPVTRSRGRLKYEANDKTLQRDLKVQNKF